MILSHHQIEDIGAAVIQDFNKFFYCGTTALGDKYVRATPIDQFARDYLGLSVRFARLSADGSNSIVVYEDTRGHIETKCKKCGKVTVFDVLSMRKIVFRLRPKEN